MSAAPLSQLLAAELSKLQEFCTLLDREQNILSGGEVDKLTSIAGDKALLAAELNRLQTAREQALATAGFPQGRAGMEAWLQRAQDAAGERQRWDQLMVLATRARLTNDANGRLISMLLRQNQDALAVLMAGSGDSIYGPDGQQRTGGSGRSLGSA